MSAANLDAVKKKFNFKEISIATWRHPSESIHPARGGPISPSLSPSAVYKPTYKVKYRPPVEFTDDEESGKDGEGDETIAERKISTQLL